jgi:hypothetical protein
MSNADIWMENYRATEFINYDGTLLIRGERVKQPELTPAEVAEVRQRLGLPPLTYPL